MAVYAPVISQTPQFLFFHMQGLWSRIFYFLWIFMEKSREGFVKPNTCGTFLNYCRFIFARHHFALILFSVSPHIHPFFSPQTNWSGRPYSRRHGMLVL